MEFQKRQSEKPPSYIMQQPLALPRQRVPRQEDRGNRRIPLYVYAREKSADSREARRQASAISWPRRGHQHETFVRVHSAFIKSSGLNYDRLGGGFSCRQAAPGGGGRVVVVVDRFSECARSALIVPDTKAQSVRGGREEGLSMLSLTPFFSPQSLTSLFFGTRGWEKKSWPLERKVSRGVARSRDFRESSTRPGDVL